MVVDVRKQCGLDEITLALMRCAANRHPSAFLAADVEIAVHAIVLLFRDQRSQPGLGIQRIAYRHAFGGLGKLIEEVVVHFVLNKILCPRRKPGRS